MNTRATILASARRTINIEQKAVAELENVLDDAFAKAVEAIYHSKGRVILTGVGKSAIIANKIVATLNSTGTPAIFMHAADAIHGDLGIIQQDDVVICLSKSGNTPEIKVLVPLIKGRDNVIIALTANKSSYLAQEATHVLHAKTEEEACPNGLAPTTSTTVQLVMGDALAVALLDLRGFSAKDFAKYHPGGALGKKLYLRVSDLAAMNARPAVALDSSVKKVIVEITEKLLGVVAVLDGEQIQGVITDGDIRRMLAQHDDLSALTAKDIMSPQPKRIAEDAMAVEALDLMEEYKISQLLVENSEGHFAGVVHIQNLIKEGIL
ncbi:KpsF/GutQ family sugar-phosphate isomerase [Croceiramulus getboli]|nr:KpsF/GutQ family sugar-phosphate isomerase [Flavobacteriaceae bacterium YJPT1-3]